jgi:hypothetical protein
VSALDEHIDDAWSDTRNHQQTDTHVSRRGQAQGREKASRHEEGRKESGKKTSNAYHGVLSRRMGAYETKLVSFFLAVLHLVQFLESHFVTLSNQSTFNEKLVPT